MKSQNRLSLLTLSAGALACTVSLRAAPEPVATAKVQETVADQQTVQAETLTVTAGRGPGERAKIPFTLLEASSEVLRSSAGVTLDGALQRFPGFSLFRRGDSLTVNPSAQGVSSRGLGPSGASRSLVLLDGIPLVDAFGGWVNWSQVPAESLGSAEVVYGGGGTAWGNASLGGVLQLFSAPFSSDEAHVKILGGSRGTWEAAGLYNQTVGQGNVQLALDTFSSEGAFLTAPANRGTLDIEAWSHHQSGSLRWRHPLSAKTELLFSTRAFSERRGNGTPYQVNASRGAFVSAAVRHTLREGLDWSLTTYAQEGSFSSTFSSVAAGRATETPASDQFAVPSSAAGASWVASLRSPGASTTRFGFDFRGIQGENRERYLYSAGKYTRRRDAGGSQANAGVFLIREQPLLEGLEAFLGLRWDQWREAAGHRRETELATGAVLRNDANPNQSGGEASPSAGLVWTPAANWRVHVSGQRAFRRPTLGELYRPFRVGSVVTEANPALRTESAVSGEVGIDSTQAAFSVRAALFSSELKDAVSNITLARGPGTYPIFGFLQSGVTGRQRLNLESVRVHGLDLGVDLRLSKTLRFEGSLLWEDSRVGEATVSRDLEGRRLAQVPAYVASVGLTWQPLPELRLSPRIRWTGRSFEDDLNLLELAPAGTLDVSLSYEPKPGFEWFASAQNLTGARVEASRTVDGVYTLGVPSLVTSGLRISW